VKENERIIEAFVLCCYQGSKEVNKLDTTTTHSASLSFRWLGSDDGRSFSWDFCGRTYLQSSECTPDLLHTSSSSNIGALQCGPGGQNSGWVGHKVFSTAPPI